MSTQQNVPSTVSVEQEFLDVVKENRRTLDLHTCLLITIPDGKKTETIQYS